MVAAGQVQAGPAPAGRRTVRRPGALDAGAVRRVWADVLSLVSGKSKKAAAIVREATVQDVDGTTLVLGFKHTAHANMLNASPDVLIAALSELLGGRWQIRCEVGGQPGGGGGTRPTPPRPTAPSGPAGAPTSGGPAGSGSAPGFAEGGPRSGPAVPHQPAVEAWPMPARPPGDPVPVDASSRFSAAGSPAGPGDGWPTPAAVPGHTPQPTPADHSGRAGASSRSVPPEVGSPAAARDGCSGGAPQSEGWRRRRCPAGSRNTLGWPRAADPGRRQGRAAVRQAIRPT